MAINGGRINFQVGYTLDKTGLQQLQQSLNQVAIEAKKPSNAFNEGAQKTLQTVRQIESALKSAYSAELGSLNVSKFNQELQKSGTNIRAVQRDLTSFSGQGQVAWSKLGSAILNTNLQIRQSNTLLDRMAQTMTGTIKWGITSRIFNNITNSISDSFHYVKELDSSLNDIRIVTDKSADSMKEFAKQANEAAKALGASTRDYTEASLIYYQQGLSDTETAARTETTLKAANVTGQNTAEVSEQLTAVWNGYKVNADETELYVDKLAAVAATTAADLEELSTGMSKVASAANLMGVDMDQLNAQLATIVSVTRQAPESVGTALKTIYARMGDIEAGLDTETTLGEYTSQMESMGFNVLDANDNLRDMGDVIEEIGEKWTTLSREQQVALSQIMAGTRQYNNLLSLFDNWNMYTDALNTSAEAAGTLNKQNEIYLESTEAKLQKLRTTMEGVYGELLDTDTINTLVEAMTNLASVAEKFVGSFGGGLKSISVIGVIVANIFNKQLSRGLNNLIQRQKQYNQNVQLLQNNLEMIRSGQIKGYTDDSIAGQAAIERYNQELSIAKKIAEVRAGMSNEEYNKLTNLQQEIGLLREKAVLIEKESEQQLRNNQLLKNEDKNKITEATFGKGSYEELSNEYAERVVNAEETLETEKEALKITQEQLDTSLNQKKAEEEAYKLLEKEVEQDRIRGKITKGQYEQRMNELKTLREQDNVTQKNTQNAQQAVKTAQEKVQKAEKDLKYARELTKELEEQYRVAQQRDSAMANSQMLKNDVDSAIVIAQRAANIQNIVGTITSSVSAIAMTWGQVITLIDVISDDTISLSDKISQLLMTISFTLPMLMNSLSSFKSSATGLIAKFGTEAAAAEAATATAAGSTLGLGAAIKGLIPIIGSALAAAAPYIIAIGAIVGLGYAVYRAYTADARAAEEAAEAYKHATEAAEGAKKAYENLQATFDAYTSGVEKLKELEEGTDEYTDALKSANEQAIELIKNNKDLAQYATRDAKGLITFEGDEAKKAVEAAKSKSSIAAAAANIAEIEASNAQLKSDRTDLIRKENLRYTVKKEPESVYDATIVDSESSYLEGSATAQNSSQPEYEFEYITDEQLEDVINTINANGGLLNKEELYNIESLDNNDELINTIDRAKEEIIKLAEKTDEANKVNKLLLDESLRASLEADEDYSKLSDAEKNAIASIYGKGLTEEEMNDLKEDAQDYIDEEYYDAAFGGGKEDELHEAYAKERGWELVDDKVGDTATYRDADGNEVTVEDDIAREYMKDQYIAEHMKDYDADKKEKSISAIEKIYDYGEIINTGLAEELMGFASKEDKTFDASRLTLDTYQMLKGQSAEEIAKSLSGITDEEWSALGYEDAQQFAETFQKGLTSQLESDIKKRIKQSMIDSYDEMNNLSSELLEGNLTPENIEENENFKAIKGQLTEIKTLYPELEDEVSTFNNTALVGTQEWAEALGALQDAAASLATIKEMEELETAISKLKPTLDTEEFENQIDDILSADREVLIKVKAEGTQEFEEAYKGMENLGTMASKIGEDFKVAEQDVLSVGQAFPGIFENAKIAADGTVQLDNEVTKNAMANAQALAIQDTQNTLDKLQNQKTYAQTQANTYEAMAEVAKQAADGEISLEEAKAKITNGFEHIKQENAKITKDNENAYQKAIADTSASMGEATALNWSNAYEQATLASASFAAAARQNMLYAAGESNEQGKFDFKVNYQGQAGEIQDTEIDQQIKDIENLDRVAFEEQYKLYEQQAAAWKKVVTDTDAEMFALQAKGLESTKAYENIGKGKGANGGSGDSKKEEIDKLKDERDVYLEINQQLEAMEAHMSSLETANEKLFGQSKIDNYKKQIENLDKEIELSQDKMKISAKEVGRYQKALTKEGLTFDEEGMLTNYDEWYQAERKEINGLIKEYNKLSAAEQESKKGKKLKGEIDTKKSEFEESQSWIDSYLDSYKQFTEDENAIAEAEAEKVSKYIESLDYEIQLKVDDSELQNAYEDFQQNLMSEDNFEGKASSLARQYQNIINSGQLEARNAQIEEAKQAIQRIEQGQTDEHFGTDLEQAREHLKTLIEEQISDYEQLQELSVSIAENWGDSLDQMSEDMEDIQTEFDNLSSKAEHYANLTKLVFGDEDYAKQKQFFQNQDDINRARLNTLQQNLKVWEEQRKKTEALYDQAIANGNMAMADTYKETMDSLDETIQETTENIQSTLEETLENIADEFENAIKAAVQDAEEVLSGGLGFDVISDGLSKAKQYSDDWLDDVQRVYETNKLIRQFDDAAAAASTASAQQKILAAKQKELAILEKQDKLSQYDLDRANAQFNLTLKQIALEEAQQNKSKMVLKRDAQGNYSYQYSADQEQISKAQQEVADAELKVNELDQDRYFQLAQGLTDLNKSMLEDIEKANIEYANDEEARQQALLQIEDYYSKEKANLKEDLGIVEEHLMDSSFAYFKSLYDIDALNWKNMTDVEKATYNNFIFGDEGLVPIATSGFDKIKASLTGEEDSFDATFVEAMNTCQTALDTYKTKVDEVATEVGGDFYKIVHGEGDSGSLINTQKETENLMKENDKLITSYTGEEGVLTAVEAICIELGNQETAHLNVKKAMDKQIKSGTKLLEDMKGLGEQVDTVKGKMKDLKDAIDNIPKHKKVTIEYETAGKELNSYGNDLNNGSGDGKKINLNYDLTRMQHKDGNLRLYEHIPGTTSNNIKTWEYKNIPPSYDFKKIQEHGDWIYVEGIGLTPDNKIPKGWVHKSVLTASFDTGGYTGSWNSSNGKMAMLHEKELVLNKEDTRNILSAVNSVRMIDSIISSLEHSMKSRVFGLMMDSYSQAKGYTREDKGFEQHVQINASFPYVTDHNEIEIALNNLMNRASQLAWKDNR